MKKIFRSLFYFLACLFFFTVPADASDFNISSRLSVIYDLSGTGTSTLNLTFTNLNSTKYISSFDLDLPRTENFSLEAFDDFGPIKTEVTPQLNTYHSRLIFNRDNVGKQAVYHLTIVFPAAAPAKKDNTWEIDIPSFQTSYLPDSYSIQVSVPESFGELLSAPAAPDRTSLTSNVRTFFFSGLSPSKINRFLFGSMFSFKFSALYHVTDGLPVVLPKDNPGQQIFIDKFSVSPQNVVVDSNGNWIALYNDSFSGDLLVEGYALLRTSTTDIQLPPNPQGIMPDQITKIIYPYPYLESTVPGIRIYSPFWLNPFLPTPVNVEISNHYPSAVYNYFYQISSTNFFLSGDLENNIPVMPPFSQSTYKFYVRPKFPYTIFNPSIFISANHSRITYNFTAGSLTLWLLIICVIFSLIIIFISHLAFRAGSLFIHKSRR